MNGMESEDLNRSFFFFFLKSSSYEFLKNKWKK